MAEVFGNVNVKYTPCKSVAQLKSAADYILGKRKEQIAEGIVKTTTELYSAFGCNRDNYANSIIMTRKMHQKPYSRYKKKEILAQKISISFHPEDNEKLTYEDVYKMAEQFAHEFFWSKGYEVLFAVHTDTEHIHAHFLVSNCNQKDGKSFRRGPKELVEMSKYFGEQCEKKGLVNSIRDTFYNPEKNREERTFAEHQMKKRGKLSFKDEIKTYIRLTLNDSHTKSVQDVVDMLSEVYGMDIRWKGKTISYALPYDLNKGGKTKAVRGSKLGKRFTVEGIEQYLKQKGINRLEYQRMEKEIEESKVSVEDYETWQEGTEASAEDISVYQAFDEFMESKNIPENDTDVFYGGAFHEFHKKWQGISDDEVVKETEVDYTKLSMKERAELLPPPTDDTMEEFEQFKNRMGYSDEKMRSVRYKMEVYDDFLKEYDYRKKIKGMQKAEREKMIKKDRDYTR
ncbi:MAG: relaxase/mobilization nuclease domain-containing protein [Agathobacter sp.]|nr:relaxase/mobilization nuclease domain-containing protein [Agathobacter sp.]